MTAARCVGVAGCQAMSAVCKKEWTAAGMQLVVPAHPKSVQMQCSRRRRGRRKMTIWTLVARAAAGPYLLRLVAVVLRWADKIWIWLWMVFALECAVKLQGLRRTLRIR
jgi:hypothetical protein